MKSIIRENKTKKFDRSHGYTYVQTTLIILFLFAFIYIGFPRFVVFSDLLKERVCRNNCLHLERMYQAYLDSEEVMDSEVVFSKFKDEYYNIICPEGGTISCVDGKVRCEIHGEKGSDEVR